MVNTPAEYWNNKWKRTTIWYSAPRKKILTEYLTYREIPEITRLAKELIADYNLEDLDDIPLAIMKWVENKFQKGEFTYLDDKGETWNEPEKTLSDKGGDCDDFGILEYFLIREIIKQFNLWDKNKYRLKCMDGHVFYDRQIKLYAGRHFYLNWLKEDGEWYSVETTFLRLSAINNYNKLPQKENMAYGVINYTFNEKYIWAQESFFLEQPNYSKMEENKMAKVDIENKSKKYSLNATDLKKIGKGMGIACGGALLTYLMAIIPDVDFGSYTPLVVALASILINTALKFFQGE